MTVYLCGTVSGDPATAKWREEAIDALEGRMLDAVNPIRGQEQIDRLGFECNVPSRLFVARDLNDVRKCDALLLYFPLACCNERQSIGTWTEFGAAVILGKPIIVVSDDPNVINHPMIREKATLVVPTLTEAYEALTFLDMPTV